MEAFAPISFLQDLAIPLVVASFYWIAKRGGTRVIQWIARLMRSSRFNSLKRAKELRVDPFAIQRQIAKEEALFCAFLVATVISIGLMFLAVRGTSNLGVRAMYFGMYVLPVLGLEAWWLWHREFVTHLLEEASRIGHTFRRSPPPRIQQEARIKSREARRAALARRPKGNTKRVGRRLV